MANTVIDTLTATGGGKPITVQNGWLKLTGTWAGTVNLQTGPNPDGSWSNVTDGTGTVIALTGNANCPVDNAIPTQMRVFLTYTSGTLTAELTSQIPF